MATGIYGGECIGQHTAYVYDRGGITRVAQILDVSSIKWGRERDAVSTAELVVEGSACSAQAKMLAAIEPKRSEIVIFRGADRVWEGPVWRVGWHANHVEIEAKDVMGYVHGTPLSIGYSSAYPNVETVTGRIKRILDHEMPVWENLKDPPAKAGGAQIAKPANVLPHVVYHHFPNEAQTTAITIPFEMTAGEHIQHLAHYSGIDYTVIGRAIHFWDVSRSLGRTRTLTEADFFSEVVVTAYGADLTTKAVMIAQDGRYGVAEKSSSYYGPWTTIHTSYNEEGTPLPTQAELNSQAQRSLSGR